MKVWNGHYIFKCSWKNSKWKCPDCPSKLLNPKTFNQHLKTHGGSCSAKFSKQDKPTIDEHTSVELRRDKLNTPQHPKYSRCQLLAINATAVLLHAIESYSRFKEIDSHYEIRNAIVGWITVIFSSRIS